ncbi:MAG: peptide-methionine (R)-S-oxide reductase MsrB [Acidobacteria bacterium]|nr:peptide-methionine (R)-S-oxide reductase MsrB [Acidobacteriota bacterium]MCA1641926.1 peptide-methionine (R)-S-oxide reductase MsrB [Acidobacteriota bacterium]
MNRRFFLQSAAALGAAALVPEAAFALASNDQRGRKGKGAPLTKITRSDEEWKRLLTPEQYRVTRQGGTEAPYSSPLNEEHGRGVFQCVGCGLPLFSSAAKFDSHTGWPSFFAPISKRNVSEHADNALGMSRTEVLCARCDAHLGHVFDDGPRPTGLRYCMNGVALKFVKGG